MHVLIGWGKVTQQLKVERPRVARREGVHVLGLNGSSVVVNYISATMYGVPPRA